MAVAFVVLAVVLAGLMLWSRSDMSAFLARHSTLSNRHALEDFKQVVRRNMYGALAYMVLGGIGLLLGIALTVTQGLSGLALVLGVNVPLLLLGLANKQLETRARQLPCTSSELVRQVEQVGHTWVHKALPDF
jgi:sulfite exporter TauE/SafE